MKEREIVFRLKNLKTYFTVTKGFLKKVTGYVKAVDDVSIDIYRGETLGIVGESGCGKTTLGKTIMLLEKSTDGEVNYFINGRSFELSSFNTAQRMVFRKKVQMVFQDPYSALNPVKKVMTSMEAPLKVQGIRSKEERENIIHRVLKLVNLLPEYLLRYPHEFSGGQRQRICIARSIEVSPEVLVCDEPVSALDVSIQAQVLNLMKKIQKEMNLTYIFIAHDLAVVQYMSDRIAVMYLGKIVEISDSEELYKNTLHPYTKALVSAIPNPDIHVKRKRTVLKGDVPSAINKPAGCAFHTRCPNCMEICKTKEPELKRNGNGEHWVACHLYKKNKGTQF